MEILITVMSKNKMSHQNFKGGKTKVTVKNTYIRSSLCNIFLDISISISLISQYDNKIGGSTKQKSSKAEKGNSTFLVPIVENILE